VARQIVGEAAGLRAALDCEARAGLLRGAARHAGVGLDDEESVDALNLRNRNAG
jgi:hypothetical protein